MDFQIDFSSGVPIYVQLKDEIRYKVAAGLYPPGMQLPTVRQLAVSLRINPNTVSRVYSELEREGILATRQGKGTFVRESDGPGEVEREQRLAEILEHFLKEARSLGYSPEEVLDALNSLLGVGLAGKGEEDGNGRGED